MSNFDEHCYEIIEAQKQIIETYKARIDALEKLCESYEQALHGCNRFLNRMREKETGNE